MTELDHVAISKRRAISRHQAGFSQKEMASLLGVHVNTVANWENPKKKTLRFDRLDEWAGLTGVTKEWLLLGDEPERGLREEVVLLRREVARLAQQVPQEPQSDVTLAEDDRADATLGKAERAEFYRSIADSRVTLEEAWWKYDSIDGAAPGSTQMLLIALTAMDAMEEIERVSYDEIV